jgi:methionine synthase II (cobalamin-independent)
MDGRESTSLHKGKDVGTLLHNLGFPCIGVNRELKHAVEAFWKGESTLAKLEQTGRELRAGHWRLQQDRGVRMVPVGDFAWYDRMLNMSALLGCAPRRFGFGGKITLDQYFQLARGNEAQGAMEMTKWFDTNYHYLVPEFDAGTFFSIGVESLFDELAEARQAGAVPKPVLIGPLTFLWLGKVKQADFNRLALLPALLPVYVEVLRRFGAQGVEWVQMDEPALVQDLPTEWLNGLRTVYSALGEAGPKLLLATYFGSVAPLAAELKALPVAGLHLDLQRAPEQLSSFLADFPTDKVLSAGVVDGRNIWRNDLEASLELLEAAHRQVGDRLWLAPSCSLLHVPVDLERETDLDPEVKGWLAFAVQKLGELGILGKALEQGRESVMTELASPFPEGPHDVAARPKPESSRAAGLPACGCGPPSLDIRGPENDPASGPEVTPIPYHHNRILPSNRSDPFHPGDFQAGPLVGNGVPRPNEGGDPARCGTPGGTGAGCAGPWRARTERHGGVFRRAVGRFRVYPKWLGAKLRKSLRQASRTLRRRVAPRPNDPGMDTIRPRVDGQADERHRDGSDHDPEMVFRAR